MMNAFRKGLIWTHRYLGMAASLLFLMWFLTGIGMMYSRGMPRLTPEMRLARLAPVDLDQVRLAPSEAANRAGLLEVPQRATLLTVMNRPAYRFEGRTDTTVFADTGEIFLELTLDDAIRIASQFLGIPEEAIQYDGLITEPDQWTLTLGHHLPMYRLAADDGAGTELYVAPRLGEVVQLTTRGGRRLAWVSVIPHFLYFRALRLDGDLWNVLMVWGPGLGLVVALVGLLLGVIHFRPRRPYRLTRIGEYIPYRGWLRWHFAAGLMFGIVTVTFVGSGLLSMEPWAWTMRDDSLAREAAAAFPSTLDDLADFPAIESGQWRSILGDGEVKEIAMTGIAGEPHFVTRTSPDQVPGMGWPDGGHQPYFVERQPNPERIVISAATLKTHEPLSAEVISTRIRIAIPDAEVVESTVLTDYDWYYYSREGRSPLPVHRLKLNDQDATWLYVDPEIGQVVGRINRVNRLERWLYAGLHTFDFPFLQQRRPLWDVIIIVFCLGGAFISSVGLMLGVRRIARGFKRMSAPAGV